jgi:NAD(P)-dependent dehydrogenase (short-subunit alcohol dehydrogenase family)
VTAAQRHGEVSAPRAADQLTTEEHQRSCLVVGAAGGLGRAIASRFLDLGWTVHGWDVASIADARIRTHRVDVTDWRGLLAAAEQLPPLEAVVNSSGAASRTPAVEMEPSELSEIFEVNVVGAFALSRAVLPALQQGGGTLVHLASVGGHLGFRNRLAYDTSKAALLAMVRHLAIEWTPLGVRVVSVSPGFVRTGMAERGVAAGLTRLSDIVDHAPTGRMVEPDEIASAVAAIVGSDFAGMTGSDLLIDGGFVALSGF